MASVKCVGPFGWPLLFSGLFLLANSANACSCNPFVGLGDHFKAAESVFYGEIIQVDVVNLRNGDRSAIKAKFTVKEVFKGEIGPEIELIDDDRSTCSQGFSGRYKRYVLFLRAGGGLGACQGNRQLYGRAEDRVFEENLFKELRDLKANQPQP